MRRIPVRFIGGIGFSPLTMSTSQIWRWPCPADPVCLSLSPAAVSPLQWPPPGLRGPMTATEAVLSTILFLFYFLWTILFKILFLCCCWFIDFIDNFLSIRIGILYSRVAIPYLFVRFVFIFEFQILQNLIVLICKICTYFKIFCTYVLFLKKTENFSPNMGIKLKIFPLTGIKLKIFPLTGIKLKIFPLTGHKTEFLW
jgi:hypothetical protein